MSLHGGDIYKIYRENGKKVIDYSANINSLGFPKKLKKNIRYFDNCLNYFVDTYKDIFSKKTGFGFMQGLVLKDEKKLEEIINLALKNRILVLKSGKNIIRFLPPLNISKKEMKQGFKRFENALIEIKK